MKKQIVRILSLIGIILMLLPMMVFAAESNYSVEILPYKQDCTVGENVNITFSVDSDKYEEFNTLDLEVIYDANKLKFEKNKSEGLSGYSVDSSKGSVRILGYGKDKNIGEVINLSFSAIETGETKVLIDSCKLDNTANANTQDAPNSEIINKEAHISIEGEAIDSPPTGDSMAVILWGLIAMILIAVIILLIKKIRKDRELE